MSAAVPSREEFHELARAGNLIPVYREVLADGDTPVSAYAKLGRRDHSFLLESVVGGEKWAAYSFIGVEPRAIVRWALGGKVEVTWRDVEGGGPDQRAEWAASDPAAALSEIMGDFRAVAVRGLPRFWGGAVGWIGYDVVRAFEDLPTRKPNDMGLPDLCLVLTDTVVIFDNLRQTVKLVAAAFVPRPDKADEAYDAALARIDGLARKLASSENRLRPLPPPPSEDGPARLSWGGGAPPRSSFGKLEFLAAVKKAKEYIHSGDAFQIVLSQRFEVERGDVDPFDVYRALRVINPSPYMFHLDFPDARVTGASPECMVRLDGGRLELRPLAGTRPRGATPEEDAALGAELKADPKERAEHVMLVDLGRNDIGRVARTGSVSVSEMLEIERYSHVMHLVSNVRGELAEGRNAFDVLRATFPAGTLSGAPKIRAMEIIDELEPHRRGIYGGVVGYVSYTGNLDLAIAIRTLVARGDKIYVQAGAGLVYDSEPQREHEETVNKARAVLRAVQLVRGS